jgi:hypothetical protein
MDHKAELHRFAEMLIRLVRDQSIGSCDALALPTHVWSDRRALAGYARGATGPRVDIGADPGHRRRTIADVPRRLTVCA